MAKIYGQGWRTMPRFDDLTGHDWAEVQRDGVVVSYACQSCGHVEPKDLVICRAGEARHFVARFGADNVRESSYAPLGPGEAYAVDGRTACQVPCARPKATTYAYRGRW